MEKFTPTRANQAKPTTSRWTTRITVALSILAILTAAFSSYTAYRAYAATQYSFPQGQTFSIGVAYSFASSTSNNLLLPGSSGTVNLTITSGLRAPAQVAISFNATDPTDWGWPGNKPSGFCDPGPPGSTLTMSLNGQVFLPANANMAFLNGCGSVQQSITVTVNPGTNTYAATLSVASNAALANVFTIHWAASTA